MTFGKLIPAKGLLLRRPLNEVMKSEAARASGPAALEQVPSQTLERTNPLSVLTSIRGVIYDWNIVTGELQWGSNLTDVLNVQDLSALKNARHFNSLIVPDGRPGRQDFIIASGNVDAGAGVPYRLTYALAINERERVHIEDTGRWFAGTDRKPVRAHGVLRVIHAADAISDASGGRVRDPLTGLFSREYLVEQAARMFEQSARNHSTFAILLASVENLGFVNQAYGYDIADELIFGVAKSLAGNVRATDLVARYSGNRFAMLLESCDTDQMAAAAHRFIDIISATPVQTSAGTLPTSLRVGGVVAPRQARGPRALLQHAEEALDVARERATQRFVGYLPSLVRDEARLRAMTIADDVTSALNQRRVRLALQPIVHAKSGVVAFHEALLRIEALDGSIVSPGSIFPTAEKIGLAQLLDHRVLELAIAQLEKDPSLRLAINCSGATAYDPEWPDQLAAMLADKPDVIARLIIEVTETCVIADIEATKLVFAAIKKLGLRIAMDDFGAGHTSFRNLRDLHVDILKLDGAFVQNLSRSADDRFFVRTLIDLANHLGVETVAEWVEDGESAKILADWGVTYLQGHFFGVAQLLPVDAALSQVVAELQLSA